jgi:20S proteasome alpha/beta subunit
MTFIVSSKCVDGVVLIADRKITIISKDGLNFDFQKKLFGELRHVVFGSSGSTGNYELFRGHVKNYVRKNPVSIDEETVEKYKAIGIGAKYAKVILEKMWNSQMTMEQFAELGYFIIRYIEKFRLEGSVGLDNENLQVWYMPNRYVEDEQGNIIKNDDRQPSDEELDRISIRVERRLKKHEKQLGSLFDSKSFRA